MHCPFNGPRCRSGTTQSARLPFDVLPLSTPLPSTLNHTEDAILSRYKKDHFFPVPDGLAHLSKQSRSV